MNDTHTYTHPDVNDEQLTELFNTAKQLNNGDVVEFTTEFEPRTIYKTELHPGMALIHFVDPENGEPDDSEHPIWCLDVGPGEEGSGGYSPQATINNWEFPATGFVTDIEIQQEDDQQRAVVDFDLNEE